MAEGDDSDKTEEPTQRKLEQAHEQGDVIKSQEVGTFFSLVGVTAIIGLAGASTTGFLVPPLRGLIEHAADLAVDVPKAEVLGTGALHGRSLSPLGRHPADARGGSAT